MARKTVRVKIPYSKPDDLITLAKQINNKHESLGETSPLLALNKMDAFAGKLSSANQLRDESKTLRAESESKMEEAKLNLGTAAGQSKETPDTVYNLLLQIRDQLLVTYRGNEEKLSEWGFDVVVGQAKA
jgi:cell division protein ZapA (FtsZ GTPase activity inhibitor)